MYGPGIVSASALIAFTSGSGSDVNPVPIQSPGVDITVLHSLVVYAAGADSGRFDVTVLTRSRAASRRCPWPTDQGSMTTKRPSAFQLDVSEAAPGATAFESVQTITSTCRRGAADGRARHRAASRV